jgi:diguanylate cyclase (GGDEF)-like protein/PAS domain S-box-containing protein
MIDVEILKRWRHSLVARSIFVVFLVVMLIAGISSIIVSNTVGHRESEQAEKSLNELVEVVANTASIASFAHDEQLASEVVQGMMRNSDVLRVSISSTEGVLAQAERGNTKSLWIEEDNKNHIIYPLDSPFLPGEQIGSIHLDADWNNIESRVKKITEQTLVIQIMQMALVVAITAAIMYFFIVRPIKAISDRLHRLGGESGNLLTVPRGHQKSEIGQLVGDINDLTGRLVATLEQERDLQRLQIIARRKYQNLFDHAASGIFVADRRGQLESFNRAFANFTWLPESERIESRLLTEISWRAPAQLITMLANSLDEISDNYEYQDDFLLVSSRGIERWVNISILPLGDGHVQGTIVDVTQRKEEEISAKHQAITDPLTGFLNRAGLQHSFHDLSIDTEPFTLVMIDLSGFKQINEALGFHVGDQLLLRVSARLEEILSIEDHAARIDADEFVLILKGEQKHSTINKRMDSLLQELNQPYEIRTADHPDKANNISINATIGIALFPLDGNDLNELLRSAELALRSSEDRNESSYHYFDPAQQVAVEHRRMMEDDLRQAINDHELQLFFQPIIDIHAGRMVGAEALLRWNHPEQGMIPPDVFIPLAEQVGLINQIGIFVLEEACLHAADWRKNGIDIYISVNVSAKQIPNGLSPEVVQKTLEEYKLSPDAIVIEITEGLLMSNVAVAQTWIESIRALGLRIYLDDFGTGYSSLSYLKRFPMDTVKIDRSFIRDLYIDKSDRALVEAIITMATSLGLHVVAEGVEDAQQLAILTEMGCGYVQGYHFSRPIEGPELAPFMLRINDELSKKNKTV